MKRNIFFRSNSGSTTLQAAVAMPIFIGMLFMFQDAVVIGYNWLSLQRAANEGIRKAVLGKASDTQTQAEFRTSISDTIKSHARSLAVEDGESFMATDDSKLYKGSITGSDNIKMGPTNIVFGTDLKRPVYSIEINKTITVTPVTGVLMSLAGGADGAFKLTVVAHGRMERECTNDYCASEL